MTRLALILVLLFVPTAYAKEIPMPPSPDNPPRRFKPGSVKPTGYETFQNPDGSWGLRPTGYRPGKTDPALVPKVSVAPIHRRVKRITRDGNRPL